MTNIRYVRVTLSHVPALSSQPWRRRHLATPVNVFQQKFTVDLYCIFNCCTRHTWWTASPSFCSKATPRKIKCHLNTQYHWNIIILIILTHLPPPLHPYLHTDAIFQAAAASLICNLNNFQVAVCCRLHKMYFHCSVC